ncbi:MAG: DUF4173 domain-containing protein [Victivallaceae bacterium]|nr:DUF4173 domain-containing protein [Victivallaceae bacterium]MDD5663697.1 DUF4173 domain-containing protein [Victivallaceae bacterium]
MYSSKFFWGCLVLTAAADFLFYDVMAGCNLGIFLLLMGGVLWLIDGRKLYNVYGGICSGCIVILATTLFLERSFLAFGMGLLLIFMLKFIGENGWTDRYLRWIGTLGHFLGTGFVIWLWDLRKREEKREQKHRIKISWLLKWGIPLFLTFIFILLFRSANPIIDQWLSAFSTFISNLDFRISLPAPSRILFWAVTFIWIWAFIRLGSCNSRIFERISDAEKKFFRNVTMIINSIYGVIRRRTNDYGEVDISLMLNTFLASVTVRCLILFNFLFLLQNLLDIKYLWGGSALPSGMTYASYAHRGAYPLIATALLAAVFALICFSGNKSHPSWRPAKLLVYLWLAQNIFLVGSAIFRLMLYVNIYRLTLLRVSALIWMVLVGVGLILILYKIIMPRDNRWLINANVLVIFAVLTGCCFIDFRGFIAEYNIRHCLELAAPEDKAGRMPLDIDYFLELGPNVLPALERLNYSVADFSPAQQHAFKRVKDTLKLEVSRYPGNWQSWTWRMSRLKRL